MAEDAEPDLKLEIAHILTIDVVAYSTLLIHEQSRVMAELNRAVRSTARFRRAEAESKLTRLPTGDGMALVFFGDPEAPIECALQISEELKGRPEVRLRMGIHSGPINQILDVNDRSNVAGAGIDMAQRVMDCGDAGHILVSKRVADDLVPYPRWHRHLHDLGECQIKHSRKITVFNFYTDELGNPAPPEKFKTAPQGKQQSAVTEQGSSARRWTKSRLLVALLIALIAGALLVWLSRRGPAVTAPEKRVAVLPFDNRSEEKANAYFADAIQDEILTRLSKIAGLKVISRTSTQHYKSAPENLREIARQLDVAYVVEGSVQKSGDAVRVNVQLIDAATDAHVWGDTFDRKLTDLFSVETEVAKAIADQLRVRLTGREEQLIAARPTENPEAHDMYLRGMAYTLRAGGATPANALGAQKYLREAVRLDPKFALAWAQLSIVDSRGYVTASLQPTLVLRDEARNAADTALSLQPDLGEAVYAKGYYFYACPKDYDNALRYLEKARQLLPNSSRIPESLAFIARRRAQWDASENYFSEAEQRDPRNVYLLQQHAASYIVLRQFPEALRKLDEVLNITPDDVQTLAQKASVFQARGELMAAAALLAPLRPSADDTGPLQVQAYQAILERRSSEIVPRLQAMCAQADPALGYLNGELGFWIGWAQQVGGDPAGARLTWEEARHRMEASLNEQPENYSVMGYLALTDGALGDKPAAFALSERAMSAITIEKDALLGPFPIEIFARVAAQAGEEERALDTIEKLLATPYAGPMPNDLPLTPALLRLDPMFDRLRIRPRFERILSRGHVSP